MDLQRLSLSTDHGTTATSEHKLPSQSHHPPSVSSNFDNNVVNDSQYVQFGHNINFNYDVGSDDKRKQEKRQLLQWISADSASDRFQAVLGQHQKGTGSWLTTDAQFRQWFDEKTSSCLWLSGKMGSGKSVLASLVVQHFLQAGMFTSFFFCDGASRAYQLKDATTIYTCLLRQVLQHPSMHIPEEFNDLYASGERLGKTLARERLISLMQAKMEQLDSPIVLVLDALDECDIEVRADIMYDLLAPLLESPQGIVKIFLSSRLVSDIDQFFSCCVEYDVRLFRMDVQCSDDINAYIKEQIQRLPLSSSGKAEAIQTLSARCDGMFRWAEMCIGSLRKPGSQTSRLQRLDQIPRGLMELYEEVYSGTKFVDGADQMIVQRSLAFLTSPNWHCKDLLASELVGAIYGRTDDRTTDEQIGEILDLCCHMVELDKTGEVSRLRLAHVSVREFLEQRSEVLQMGSSLSIALLCLNQVCDFFNDHKNRDWDLGQFICYALMYWPRHVYLALLHETDAEMNSQQRELEKLRSIVDAEKCQVISNAKAPPWLNYLSQLQRNPTWLRDETLSVSLENYIVIREPEAGNFATGAQRKELPNPLFIFARHNVQEVLVTRNPIAPAAWTMTQDGQSILEALCQQDSETRLQRLLSIISHDSRANLLNALRSKGVVLVNAVKEQNQELTEFLLKHCCTTTDFDKDGATVLHYTAGFVDLKLTERLILNGANVNAQTIRGESPLTYLFLAPAHQKFSWSWKDDQAKVVKFIKQVKSLILCLYQNGADLFHRNIAGFSMLDLRTFVLGAYRPSPPNQINYLFRWIHELMKKDVILQISCTGTIKKSGGWELGNPRSSRRWQNLVRHMNSTESGVRRVSNLLSQDGMFILQ